MDTAKTIYLVDDDPDDRMFISQAFHQVTPGVKVVEAASGFELLTLIVREKDSKTALILMDINMPKMSGIETLRALKSDLELSHIPVVMISTTSNPTYIKNAYEEGIAGFICKPSTLKGFTDLANQVTTDYFE
jgi:CheY-like chemotaxis protein